MKKIKIKAKFKSDLKPKYQTKQSAGMDVQADIERDITVEPGQRVLIPTGLYLELPEGFEMQVRPRSGLAIKHGISLVNSPGTIDADYRGEVGIILINHGQESYTISKGERIAQLVLSRVYQANLISSKNLTFSKRGTGGFGSTGK